MGRRADADLHESLTKIIGTLNEHADSGHAMTPGTIHMVSRTLGVIRDCHRSLAEYEALMAGVDNVVPIHGHSVRVDRLNRQEAKP